MEPRKEPKTYTPAAVEISTAYPSAPVTGLVSVAEPAVAPAAAMTITEDRRKTLDETVRVTAATFGVNLTEPLEWSADTSIHVIHRSKDGAVLLLYFDERNEITHVYLTGSDLPDNGTKMVTPELFEAYARECYRKAFGVLAVGEIEFDSEGSGLKAHHNETARWRVIVKGSLMNKLGSVTARMDGMPWSLSCRKGPSAGEVQALTEALQTRPTRITEEAAVAIAWKNWKKVRAEPFTGNDFNISCELREVTQEEKEPWGEHASFKTERLAWENKTPGSSPTDPVFYEVHIRQVLFEINLLIDRQTGQVLRMNQGRMSW